MDRIEFRVNGATVDATGVDPHKSLLHFLRERGLTGTKEGCAEGECGACAVVVVRPDQAGKARYVPVNSCLVLTPAMAGHELITVEGVADVDKLHPVQQAMVDEGGSQCGYCTPGFVMSLFAEYYRKERSEGEYDPEAIAGNLCRCTGYRPIRDALVSLKLPSEKDTGAARLEQPAPSPESILITGANNQGFFARPTDLAGVFDAMKKCPKAKLVAGGTDVVVGINQFNHRHDGLIALDGVAELRGIEETDETITIGAGVPLSEVEAHFHHKLDIFDELFVLFSSRLIRNRATLGGNLVNASPIGDSPPALLALDAKVVIVNDDGERTVELADFFTDYRKTVLQPGELLRSVVIPKPLPSIARFYKVSKRVMDDISTVAAGFGIWLGDDGKVEKARLAYGGVAATPVRVKEAEAALVGQTLHAGDDILSALHNGPTPIGDHRGSAEYRKAMLGRLFEKFCAEQSEAEAAQ